jgi:hypothetical protein
VLSLGRERINPEHRWAWVRIGCLVAVLFVVAFAVRRVVMDFPTLGVELPRSAEDAQYAVHRSLAYAHIAPGVIYLVGGALQLSARLRRRHYSFHRRLGRVVLACGLVSGLFAIVFGLRYAFGGPVEAVAALCFGVWFEACLVAAYLCIRRHHVAAHRRWMIRAYATAAAVGTIRVLVVVMAGSVGFATSFAIGFWAAFMLHLLVAEMYVRRAPALSG